MTSQQQFPWPEGARAAVSLTFDDARLSQPDTGIPLLNRYGVRATFYVSFGALQKRLPQWRAAVRAGHEIGNHTVHHPCSINYGWAKQRALEDFTLAQMRWELTEANAMIEKLLGVVPETFAYPCGQKYVGRGRQQKSYVPLVAERFLAGRSYADAIPNDPLRCDLAQVFAVDCDGLSFARMKERVDFALQCGGWLVVVGHEMGGSQAQAVGAQALRRLCRYLTDPANRIWVAPVQEVACHIQASRKRLRGR